jgi:accessory gene regulator protein AgrB
MKYTYLIGGLVAFGLSFIVHRFFIQFIVLGVFLIVLYIIEKNSCDVAALKKSIEDHNELIKKDIEELKKHGD